MTGNSTCVFIIVTNANVSEGNVYYLANKQQPSRETVLVIRVVCKSRVLERREAKIRSIVYEWHSVLHQKRFKDLNCCFVISSKTF